VRDAARFAWFETPDAASLAAGTTLLRKLGAIDAQGGLAPIGRRMLRFPAHPRLARLLIEGEDRGVGQEAAALAALLSEGDISDSARARFGDPSSRGATAEGTDLLERLDRFAQARALRFERGRLHGLGVDARAAESAERARRQYAGALTTTSNQRPTTPEAIDDALAMATLTAFPDRVMRRRSPGATQAVLTTGGAAEVGPLPPAELLVAVDAEERSAEAGRRGGKGLVVRLAVGIQPEWLLDLVPEGLSETEETSWNADTERVEVAVRLCYGAVVLDEGRRPAPPSPKAGRLLAEAALAGGMASTEQAESSMATLQVKLELLRRAFPKLSVPLLNDDEVLAMVVAACEGLTSMAELRAVPMAERVRGTLPSEVAALLRNETPDTIRLPGGHQTQVHYPTGQSPWIASRLQDFFGLRTGPAVCGGRVPLTLHLLAPNHRAVQVTSDLAGFWQKHYAGIRRELGRRYPRHAWPEDGATATPPPPRPPRPPRR